MLLTANPFNNCRQIARVFSCHSNIMHCDCKCSDYRCSYHFVPYFDCGTNFPFNKNLINAFSKKD